MNTPFDSSRPSEDLGPLSPAEQALLEWAEIIDADLDGSIDPTDRERLHARLREDAALREAYDEARFSHELFEKVEMPTAPRSVREGVLAAIDAESAPAADDPTSRPMPRRSPAPRPRRDGLLQFAGVAAAVIALLVVMLPGRFAPDGSHDDSSISDLAARSGYSEAELEEAAEEVRMAMAVLSRSVGGTTAELLRSEMRSEVGDRIRGPLRESLRRGAHSIPYLIPDAGNDQHSRNLSPPRARPEVLEMVSSLERTTT